MTIAFGGTTNPDLIAVPRNPPMMEDGQISRWDWINFIQKLASVTPNYREGSFTASLVDAGGTFATGTMEYRIIGNMCYVTIPNASITGTSGGTTFTITGIPAAIVTRNTQAAAPVGFVDNGAFSIVGRISIAAGSNVWTCRSNFNVGAWTATNTKGIVPQTFAFPLN